MNPTLDEKKKFHDNYKVINQGMKLFEKEYLCRPNAIFYNVSDVDWFEKFRHLFVGNFKLRPIKMFDKHPGFFHLCRDEFPQEWISIQIKELRP